MSVTPAAQILEEVIRTWIIDTEIKIYIAMKRGADENELAHGYDVKNVSIEIRLKDLTNEIIPEIKQHLGL